MCSPFCAGKHNKIIDQLFFFFGKFHIFPTKARCSSMIFWKDLKPIKSWNAVRRITAQWAHFVSRWIFFHADGTNRKTLLCVSTTENPVEQRIYYAFKFHLCSRLLGIDRKRGIDNFSIAIVRCMFTIWIPILFTLNSSLIKRYLLGAAWWNDDERYCIIQKKSEDYEEEASFSIEYCLWMLKEI